MITIQEVSTPDPEHTQVGTTKTNEQSQRKHFKNTRLWIKKQKIWNLKRKRKDKNKAKPKEPLKTVKKKSFHKRVFKWPVPSYE